MPDVGDVLFFYSPTVGKPKYHLCLGYDEHGGPRFALLFINSNDGYKGDCVLDDGDIPGLPKSKTGQSVVSFTNITNISEDKLNLFGSSCVGKISGDVAGILLGFVENTDVLTKKEKKFIASRLEILIKYE